LVLQQFENMDSGKNKADCLHASIQWSARERLQESDEHRRDSSKIAGTQWRTKIALFRTMNIMGLPLVTFVLSAAAFLGIFALEVTASTLAGVNII